MPEIPTLEAELVSIKKNGSNVSEINNGDVIDIRFRVRHYTLNYQGNPTSIDINGALYIRGEPINNRWGLDNTKTLTEFTFDEAKQGEWVYRTKTVEVNVPETYNYDVVLYKRGVRDTKKLKVNVETQDDNQQDDSTDDNQQQEDDSTDDNQQEDSNTQSDNSNINVHGLDLEGGLTPKVNTSKDLIITLENTSDIYFDGSIPVHVADQKVKEFSAEINGYGFKDFRIPIDIPDKESSNIYVNNDPSISITIKPSNYKDDSTDDNQQQEDDSTDDNQQQEDDSTEEDQDNGLLSNFGGIGFWFVVGLVGLGLVSVVLFV